jgi:hypothetical protein
MNKDNVFDTMPSLTNDEKKLINKMLEQVLESSKDFKEKHLPDIPDYLQQVRVLSKHLGNEKDLIFDETDICVILQTFDGYILLNKLRMAKAMKEMSNGWEKEVKDFSEMNVEMFVIYAKFLHRDTPLSDFLF